MLNYRWRIEHRVTDTDVSYKNKDIHEIQPSFRKECFVRDK